MVKADIYEDLFETCDREIRSGQINRAVVELKKINAVQLPRSWRAKFAKLCRRAGLVTQGLRILTPVVLAKEKRLDLAATHEELAEYAILLQRMGSVKEASQILSGVPIEVVPESGLYQAFCCFNQWEYERAIPYLEAFLGRVSDPYQRQVGRINLAAALVMLERHDQALDVLNWILGETAADGQHRLLANGYELFAQVYIQRNDLSSANEYLNLGMNLLKSSSTHDTLFLRKWRAYLDAAESNDPSVLLKLREESARLAWFETVREADYLYVKLTKDQNTFDKLYFGTPFSEYRRRLEAHFGMSPSSDSFLFGCAANPSFRLHLSSGTLNGKECFPPGGKVHQLIEVLFRDWYRPAAIGQIFGELFEGEKFDIFSSPDRVHQILRRTRACLKELNVPMTIVQERTRYSPRINGQIQIEVPLARKPVSWFDVQLPKLLGLSMDGIFRASEVIKALNLTEAEYKRFIRIGMESGRLVRIRGGRSSTYQIPEMKISGGSANGPKKLAA